MIRPPTLKRFSVGGGELQSICIPTGVCACVRVCVRVGGGWVLANMYA